MKIIKTLLLLFAALLLTLAGYAQTSARLYNENYMFTALYDDFSGTSLSDKWYATTNYAREIGYFVDSTSTIGVGPAGLKLSMLSSPNYMGTV